MTQKFTLLVTLFICVSSYANEFKHQSTTLKNGLKVIVCEKTDNDFVEFEVWYRTGSKDEKPGIRGMAHLFEHMMFRGTKKYPGDTFAENIEKIGGYNNAYTTFDRTVYHEYIPTSALENVIDMEADRMNNLVVTQDILNTERQVVGEELRNSTNSWFGRVDSMRYTYLYPKGHPYEVNVIGFLNEITSFTSEQCMEFYNNYYSPNNAYIVVIGNVKSENVFAMVEKYFGSLTKQLKLSKREDIPSLDTTHIRVKDMSIEFPLQIYSYVFASPSVDDKDFFAFTLLMNILFSDENSILNNRLVKKEHLAYGFQSSNDWCYYPSLTLVDIFMDAQPGNVKVKKAIREEINKIIDEGISQETLANSVTAYKNSTELNDYSSDQLAGRIGICEYFYNDYTKAFTLSEEYKKVQSSDIKAVASKYLNENRIQVINIKAE